MGSCILHEYGDSNTENLVCPANTTRSDKGAGYRTLVHDLRQLEELGCTVPLDLSVLGTDNETVVQKLLVNKAKWHKSCRNKYNRMKVKRVDKRSREQDDVTNEGISNKFTRSNNSCKLSLGENICYFCEKGDESGELHEAQSFDISHKIHAYATQLQDEKLLAKLSSGDLIAQEAKYHRRCLVLFYNKARSASVTESINMEQNDRVIYGIAFAELISYIDECRENPNIKVMKLSDLCKLYTQCLLQHGIKPQSRIHSTKLKQKILVHVPDLQAHSEGRDVLLAFEKNIGHVLKLALEKDYDDEGIVLASAAKIVRRDIFNMQVNPFNGTFQPGDQEDAVPRSLMALIKMILHGPSTVAEPVDSKLQAGINIAELVVFNAVKSGSGRGKSTYHCKSRETPLPLYLALFVHAKTRKRDMVDTLHDHGLSVSYDRIQNISTALANSMINHFETEGVVCTGKLRRGLVTTGIIDNVDHNPSSTTAQDSFHGTSISLFQHPCSANPGEDCETVVINPDDPDTTTILPLPEAYALVPPALLRPKQPAVPPVEGPLKPELRVIAQAYQDENG
jgi:hypothetical protein